ncbi:amidohydrolase 2 [Dendrothele bispora CBS 962.96]|uniref:Amidohydrolase 2 n=1 Tax=Dendrothele bispora (strain CBS 962.96) TaxID=1314807 RepID=A0A4S8LWP7_DENBC|nr:amidohydrolase 2 [Dendrothele bispora CBS 962.96]
MTSRLELLHKAAFTFPAIDNHAHPLLKESHRSYVPFEGLISEADGEALSEDAVHTLACLRATPQLVKVLQLDVNASSWGDVKSARQMLDYNDLCDKFMMPCNIQSILLDDGLGGVAEWAEDLKWHRRFGCDTKRIVRIETEAETILKDAFQKVDLVSTNINHLTSEFFNRLGASMTTFCEDPEVVGLKSIACYRTGLNISSPVTIISDAKVHEGISEALATYNKANKIRLAHKELNDKIVHVALEVAGRYKKPVQFHTGLGDNDISLRYSSPSHMQPIIKEYPDTQFVLLHSSYPYTKEAGYLTAVYRNVFCDFGEIFPFVSGPGQRSIFRQVLDLCPTNKILWSTDGHWWPESYYLGTVQARQAIYDVLSDIVKKGELTELQAVAIAENALFYNANNLYKLKLVPKLTQHY